MDEPVVVRDPNASSIRGGGSLVAVFFGIVAYLLLGWLAAASVLAVSEVAVLLFARYVISEREITLSRDGVITVTEQGKATRFPVDEISSIDGILDLRGGDTVSIHFRGRLGDLVVDPAASSRLLEAVGELLSAEGRFGIISPRVARLFARHGA